MKVLVTGAGGMIGGKLVEALARSGVVAGERIDRLMLLDVVAPPMPSAEFDVTSLGLDLAASNLTPLIDDLQPDLVFHLAAVVSGEAERDFDLGYAVNLDATRSLLESFRHGECNPRVVFASSIAVFGAPFPDEIDDEFHTTPLTSYGTQKAIGELLVSDYSRRGMIDGISIRLPTICVRPGKPNAAASGFFSNIIREPLAGMEAVLPVPTDILHWHASPRAAVGFLKHAASMDLAALGPRRALSMPGLAVTVEEQIDSLRRVAGESVVSRIRLEPDPFIQEVVAGWPRRLAARRASELGFSADDSFEAIIRAHIEDELHGEFVR